MEDGRWKMGDGRWRCPPICHLPSSVSHLPSPILIQSAVVAALCRRSPKVARFPGTRPQRQYRLQTRQCFGFPKKHNFHAECVKITQLRETQREDEAGAESHLTRYWDCSIVWNARQLPRTMNFPVNCWSSAELARTALIIVVGSGLWLAIFPSWFRKKARENVPALESLLARVQHLRQRPISARYSHFRAVKARTKLLVKARRRLDKESILRERRQIRID
jgi:hypothetical protein